MVGATEKIDFCNDEKMMVLNMISLVELCKLFLPHMYKKRHGSILNVSSTGAFQPRPFTSTYFASKAFVLSYSKAIRFEAEKYNVMFVHYARVQLKLIFLPVNEPTYLKPQCLLMKLLNTHIDS